MTPEQRLDQLERIAKLFAKAGLRARTQFNKQYEILMDAQMRNEAAFARNEERLHATKSGLKDLLNPRFTRINDSTR